MRLGGDGPHDPATGLGRQRRVEGGTDQLIAEQRHLLRPRPPRGVVIVLFRTHETSIQKGETRARTGRAMNDPPRFPNNRRRHQGRLVLR
jgi:hypothetical protein